MTPNWLNDMNLFVAVAKAKSFTKAAEQLDMPHSTLSRRITLLEKTLGLRLLHRTTRRVELTDEGLAYLDRVERLVEEANEIHVALIERSNEPQGHLRISLPPSFGDQMGSTIAKFAKLYPKVKIDIDASPTHVDLISEKFDVAIRVGSLINANPNFVSRRISSLQPYLFATPQYLKSKGIPQHPDDLLEHDCLRLSGNPHETRWNFTKKGKSISISVQGRFWFNDPVFGIILAKAGFGIVSSIEARSQNELKTGALIQVLEDWQLDPIPIYALTTARLLPAKTRSFIDFISTPI